MRFRLAAAALAAVVFAVPAPAQPGPALEMLRGVMQRLVVNTEGVENYTLTLRSGALSTEMYVYRDGDDWEVAAPDDDPLGGMLKPLVVWPSFGALLESDEVSGEEMEELGDAVAVTRETVNGRPADVLMMRMSALADEEDSGMDSVRLFVDPETRQILRVHVAGGAETMREIAPGGGTMQLTLDFADYRETERLTLPHTLRMAMELELEMDDEERAGMAAGLEAARAQMAGTDSPQAPQANAMIELFVGLLTEGRVEIPVTVENVRVNAGPPAWFQN
ncbi:MAG TPA: hypothetical protein VLK84_18330 [Longimicrobium sp.]|nr:hypothetical protein [Longimicrobium sp.]